ncbi:SMI1/KNR4 family protein [Paenibacillus sp. GCM10027627]|uniref:SMI1/KNR4 family protein n=1 Tax=unclassified Paenibacillus TaxID=185978 RepID=UPI00363AD87A
MENRISQLVGFLQQNASETNPHRSLIPDMPSPTLICVWNDPVSEQLLDDFFKDNNWLMPEDYKEFLLKCNGGILFKQPKFGGGTELLSLEKIKAISKTYCEQIPSHCFPIAWTDHRIGAILIDSNKIRSNEAPYLYFLDAMDHIEDAIPIPLTFTEFIERIIICQGAEFWHWKS